MIKCLKIWSKKRTVYGVKIKVKLKSENGENIKIEKTEYLLQTRLKFFVKTMESPNELKIFNADDGEFE